MKNRKRTFILIEMVLGIAAAAVGVMMLWGQTSKSKDKVSVIIENSDDSQWTAFKYGLKMAAMDEELELSIVNTASELTVEEEEQLIVNEIQNGAVAMIVHAVDGSDAEEMLRGLEAKVPIVLVESAASQERSESELPVIQPDNYAMGEAIGQALLQDYGGSLKGKTIGIISADYASEAVLNRQKGLLDAIRDRGGTISWSALGMIKETVVKEKPKVDFIIALDNNSVIAAGQAAAANNIHGALVYGIGRSTEAVYYVDKGIAECLVVPDEFSVGYESLREVGKRLDQYFYKIQDKTVSYTVMRQETLFTDMNQEILFTMNQ